MAHGVESIGAPNDQFVVKCIIIPQLMKINVIKAFSVVFQCCWETLSVIFVTTLWEREGVLFFLLFLFLLIFFFFSRPQFSEFISTASSG